MNIWTEMMRKDMDAKGLDEEILLNKNGWIRIIHELNLA